MAEASKNSSKPMTTANFLQQLTGGLPESSESSKTQIEKPLRKIDEDLDKMVEPLTPSPGKTSTKDMENLSDADLQTLLQNFKDLSTEEQHNLINYLKKLEYQEPERVEKLRAFVNLETGSKSKTDGETANKKMSLDRESPFSNRKGSLNPASEDLVEIESEDDMDNDNKSDNIEEPNKIHVDSEDEDYTYDDVVKTASKNVKDKEKENDMKKEEEMLKKKEADLANAKDLISNLMSNISKRNDGSKGVDLLGLGTTEPPATTAAVIPNIPASTAEFAKTLSSISMDSLANIVSTVKNMTSAENIESKPHFPPVEKNNLLNFEASSSTSRLNFDPAQLEKPSFDKPELGMGPGSMDTYYNRSYPPRGGTGFERSYGSEQTFQSFPSEAPHRSLPPNLGMFQYIFYLFISFFEVTGVKLLCGATVMRKKLITNSSQ